MFVIDGDMKETERRFFTLFILESKRYDLNLEKTLNADRCPKKKANIRISTSERFERRQKERMLFGPSIEKVVLDGIGIRQSWAA